MEKIKKYILSIMSIGIISILFLFIFWRVCFTNGGKGKTITTENTTNICEDSCEIKMFYNPGLKGFVPIRICKKCK